MTMPTEPDAKPAPAHYAGDHIATLVEDEARIDFLPSRCGPAKFLVFESLVYAYTRSMCPEYTGGFWDFWNVSNGAFLMSPRMSVDKVQLLSPNGFSGEVTPFGAGVVVTLFALSHAVNQFSSEQLLDAYDLLIDFAKCHSEWGAIADAID